MDREGNELEIGKTMLWRMQPKGVTMGVSDSEVETEFRS